MNQAEKEAYLRECRRFAEHFPQPPGRLGLEEILQYLVSSSDAAPVRRGANSSPPVCRSSTG